jgi:hypothetical protein
MKRAFLLALPCALFCVSCGPKPVEIAVPPVERFEPIPEPEVPAGDSDAEVADYIKRLVLWGRGLTGQIVWLRDWREGVTE